MSPAVPVRTASGSSALPRGPGPAPEDGVVRLDALAGAVPAILLLTLAVAAATVTSWLDAAVRSGLALGGGVLALFATWLWREGVRPRDHWAWWVTGVLAAIGCLVEPRATAPVVAFAAGLMAAHGAAGSPGALLVLGQAAILWQPGAAWEDAGKREAFQVAGGAVLLLIAALAERERLGRAVQAPVSGAWLAIPVVIGAVLAAAAVLARDYAEALRGIVPTTTGGRLVLLASLVVAVAVAGAVWWRPRPKDEVPT